jgi:hypothetical protein
MQCRWGFVAAAVAAAAFFAGAWIFIRERPTPPPGSAVVRATLQGPVPIRCEVRLPDIRQDMIIRDEREFFDALHRNETLRKVYSARYPVDFAKQMIVVAAPSTGDLSGSVELDSVFQTPRDIVIRTRVWNPAPGLRPPSKRTSVGVVIDRTPYRSGSRPSPGRFRGPVR